MKTQILISHPTANVFSLALARYLVSKGELHSYWTSIAWSQSNSILNALPTKIKSQLDRRGVDDSLNPFLRTHPIRECGRLVSSSIGLKSLYQNERSIFSVDSVYQSIDTWVAKSIEKSKNSPIVYAYEDAAYQTFLAAKANGLKCAYDLPIAHWKLRDRLYKEELERHPQWKPTIKGLSDSEKKLQRKSEEGKLADVIICPSDFVANSIPKEESKNKTIAVIPFGSPLSEIKPDYRINDSSKPLTVLFVASMSQRKGLADLFSAMALLPKKSATLKVIGNLLQPIEFYKKQYSDFEYLGTMPRKDVLKEMQKADVMVLPSIAEGRALVTQEALSQGLPIIITPNTGADDLVIEGENGFVVPIRNPEAVAEKINWFCENRKMIHSMKIRSYESVTGFTWENYARGIYHSIKKDNS